MKARFDMTRNSQLIAAFLSFHDLIEAGDVDEKLLHLVQMRASQMNGCAYCLDMQSKEVRAAGETDQRLYSLEAWRETQFYSDREQAALAWTEVVTLVSTTHVPHETYEAVRAKFSEDEIKTLTLAVAFIKLAKRLNVAMRTVPGTYKPGILRELKSRQQAA